MIHVLGVTSPTPTKRSRARIAGAFEALVERRATGEPIPFIKGYAEFRGIELLTEPGVFVPRDSSEFLAEQAVRRLRGRKKPVHVDLATGGGTIALAVADEVPKATVWGTDCRAGRRQARSQERRNLDLRATFVKGDLFGALPKKLRGQVDVITLHPPYVPVDEIEDLPDEIRDWEPPHTLTDSSVDGMGLIHRAVEESPSVAPQGRLAVGGGEPRPRQGRQEGASREVGSATWRARRAES